MFPNVRLLIGTLFIAVLVLSCEFGVFAALRVNREPLNRLTADSTQLQLTAGHNAPAAVAMSWTAPRETRTPAADAATPDIATEVAKAAAPAERVIETPAPGTGGADGTLKNDATAAAPRLALTPPPAAASMRQDPGPPAMSAAPPADEPTPPAAGAAPAQGAPAAGLGTTTGAPEQELAAAPPALAAAPAQQTAAPAATAPAPDQQAHASVAKASEPASGAPVAAAADAVAAPAAQPAEITGSVPSAATPAPPMPEAAKHPAKTAAKVAHKPAKKIRKAERKPAPVHPAKKRVVRRARAPAAAASATHPASTFDNPVFESAPQIQPPAKRRAGTKKAATNTGFGTPFGTQFDTH